MKKYWQSLNTRYEHSWSTLAQKEMSKRELDIINYYLKRSKPKTVLDIGVGTGRILSNLIKNTDKMSRIYAVDFVKKMVLYCQKNFKRYKKIQQISVCDISKEDIRINNTFDFITAIRVLQYNKNWQEILKKIYLKLNNNGTLIFTLPNYNSINRFIYNRISSNRITGKKLKIFLPTIGFKVVNIRSVTKIPDFFYQCSLADNILYTKILIIIEKIFELILGQVLFGRVLFVIATKDKKLS